MGVCVCVVSSDALRSSVFTDLRQKEACNQGKETFRAKSMQSGATPPPRLLLEIVGVKGLYPLTRHKSTLCVSLLNSKTKKAPVIGFLVPFYVKHSKGFISRLVEIARCGHYAVITTHLTVIKGGLQLDLIKIFLKLKAIFVKENLRFKTLIYISFSYIKSLSDFYHYGESWRRSGNTHPRASIKTL